MFTKIIPAIIVCGAAVFVNAAMSHAAESIWLEAEHLTGIRGYCWPMGQPAMKKTAGHWAISGPGWAAEWNQGGESGFLSIATAADDDRAVATTNVEVPADGRYFVWVRYSDWRETSERFEIRLEQEANNGKPATDWTGRYGEQPATEEDNELKLYFGWAFGWAKREVELRKGAAKLSLVSSTKEQQPRQIDAIVLTTDANYLPRVKERPVNATWDVLDEYRRGIPAGLEPLARAGVRLGSPDVLLPAAWKLRTFRDKGFLYLWNMSHTDAAKTWLSDRPDRVKVPYNIADEAVRTEFEKRYAGRDDPSTARRRAGW